MKRIDYIRTMTADEIAKIIIKSNITSEYCKSDCEDTWEEPICQDEMGCCIKWLNEEMEEKTMIKTWNNQPNEKQTESDVIKKFILDLYCMSGTGNGIGYGTVDKIKKFALQHGYLREENQ